MSTAQVAAVDLGATSGRVVVGTVGTDSSGKDVLELDVLARFPNEPLRLWNGTRAALHTDVPGLFGHVRRGLADAVRASENLVSIGVDSWAVDYGLLRDGRLLGLPHHYRDERSERGVELVESVVGRAELFARNGLQFLPFNTVYQLAVDRADGMLEPADSALLIPDLISYWLTGREVTERTNASTTGVFGVDGVLDAELLGRLGISSLFPEVVDPGTALGAVLPGILDVETHATVTAVGSHDTASAVAAIPMDPDSAVYISCGTWGLVGAETASPILDSRVRDAGFTNEAGVDGRNRLLHNVMGLWLLSETVREWSRIDGAPVDLPDMLAAAAHCPPPTDVFDADDPVFLSRGDMPVRIRSWYTERGLTPPSTRVEIVRAIVESLAVAFARAVYDAASLAGIDVRQVHVVGGGAQNSLLCSVLADRLGLPVLAGPVEATALGNVLVQARTHGAVSGELDRLRRLVATSFPPVRHTPMPASRARTGTTMTKEDH